MLLSVTNFKKSPRAPNGVSQPAARLCVAHARGGGKVVVTSSNDEGYSPFQSHGAIVVPCCRFAFSSPA